MRRMESGFLYVALEGALGCPPTSPAERRDVTGAQERIRCPSGPQTGHEVGFAHPRPSKPRRRSVKKVVTSGQSASPSLNNALKLSEANCAKIMSSMRTNCTFACCASLFVFGLCMRATVSRQDVWREHRDVPFFQRACFARTKKAMKRQQRCQCKTRRPLHEEPHRHCQAEVLRDGAAEIGRDRQTP